tara:strand:+ start:86 stop:559 length:474 start_codon:yes stop_codon:yes gene_type:complete
MKNNITKGSNLLLIIFLLVILLLCINKFFIRENFQDTLDQVDEMGKKMDEMSELEKETRMFCKILRQDETPEQIDELLDSRTTEFQKKWLKQNEIISDIKKKFIKLRLDKDNRNLINYNNRRNMKLDEFQKRKNNIELAKRLADSPYKVNFNINNNS